MKLKRVHKIYPNVQVLISMSHYVLNLVSRENGTPFRESLRLCELLSNLNILWLQPTVDPMAGRRWKTRVENGRKRYFDTNQLAVAGLRGKNNHTKYRCLYVYLYMI